MFFFSNKEIGFLKKKIKCTLHTFKNVKEKKHFFLLYLDGYFNFLLKTLEN